MIDERNYRLSSCVGFAAFDSGGRIGVVADLHYGSRSDRPDFLVIRRGLLRRRRISIPVDQVVQIDMAGRKVVVQGAPVGRIRWSHPTEDMEGAARAPFTTFKRHEIVRSSASSAWDLAADLTLFRICYASTCCRPRRGDEFAL